MILLRDLAWMSSLTFALTFGGACATAASVGSDDAGGARKRDASAADGADGDASSIVLCDTTLSGTVYDPAGALPVFNTLVYVPTSTLDAIEPGLAPTCQSCQALAGGNPSASAVTDANGHFTLDDVTPGDDVTLVMQTGKWRRAVRIPHVEACRDNAVTDRELTRLPRNQSEGSMPRIALTTGIDNPECTLLTRIGIDPGEFTAPTGSGRVHTYWGTNEAYHHAFEHGWGDASDLFGDLETLKRYDVVIDGCQAASLPRGSGSAAYENMQAYLDAGGRFFASHFDYGWFAPPAPASTAVCTNPGVLAYSCMCATGCDGTPAMAGTAKWGLTDVVSSALLVNLDLPKGRALDTWFHAASRIAGTTEPPDGQVVIQERYANYVGSVSADATSWVYQGALDSANDTNTILLSFNAPIGRAPAHQCGRAVYFDGHEHVEAADPSGTFPSMCSAERGAGSELLFEFLFFDIGTCVGDDTQPPVEPK